MPDSEDEAVTSVHKYPLPTSPQQIFSQQTCPPDTATLPPVLGVQHPRIREKLNRVLDHSPLASRAEMMTVLTTYLV